MNNSIIIKNISNRQVGITVPELRLNRVIKPNKTISLKEEIFTEAITYPGVSELFNRGYLYSPDKKKIDEISNGYIDTEKSKEDNYSEEEIIKIIENGSSLELDKILKSTKENRYREDIIITAALKAKDITYSQIDLIKKHTGKNIAAMRGQ